MTSSPEDRFGHELYDDETLAAIDRWEPSPPRSPRATISGWRRGSASGAVVGATLLGLGEALEGRGPRECPPIVKDDPGEPPEPGALVDVDFDPRSPRATTARLRLPRGRVDRAAGVFDRAEGPVDPAPVPTRSVRPRPPEPAGGGVTPPP